MEKDWTSVVAQCSIAHKVNADQTFEYYDGMIIGRCERCDHRIEFDHMPGTETHLLLRQLLLMVADEEDPNKLALAVSYTIAKNRLEQDRRSLEVSQVLFQAVERAMAGVMAGEEPVESDKDVGD